MKWKPASIAQRITASRSMFCQKLHAAAGMCVMNGGPISPAEYACEAWALQGKIA